MKSIYANPYRLLRGGDAPFHGSKSIFFRALQGSKNSSRALPKFAREGRSAHPAGYSHVFIDVMNIVSVTPLSAPDRTSVAAMAEITMERTLKGVFEG